MLGMRYSDALAAYEQTVLKALEETENALVTHARTRDQLVHAADAAESSAAAAKLARVRYEGGIVDFLEVLDAEPIALRGIVDDPADLRPPMRANAGDSTGRVAARASALTSATAWIGMIGNISSGCIRGK